MNDKTDKAPGSTQTKPAAAKTKPAAVKTKTTQTAVAAKDKKPAVKTEKKKRTKIKLKEKRISIKLPETEYAQLVSLKKSCISIGLEPKKSELVRAGLALLEKLDLEELKTVMARLPKGKALKLRK